MPSASWTRSSASACGDEQRLCPLPWLTLTLWLPPQPQPQQGERKSLDEATSAGLPLARLVASANMRLFNWELNWAEPAGAGAELAEGRQA